jgi:hypothetical protein
VGPDGLPGAGALVCGEAPSGSAVPVTAGKQQGGLGRARSTDPRIEAKHRNRSEIAGSCAKTKPKHHLRMFRLRNAVTLGIERLLRCFGWKGGLAREGMEGGCYELHRAPHIPRFYPDAETCRGAGESPRTKPRGGSNVCASLPEAGAQCGDPACWDLWRGPRATVIPTPTLVGGC